MLTFYIITSLESAPNIVTKSLYLNKIILPPDGEKFLWFKKKRILVGFFILLEAIYHKLVCMLRSACTKHREEVEDVEPFPVALGSDQTACPGTPVQAWWPMSKNKIPVRLTILYQYNLISAQYNMVTANKLITKSHLQPSQFYSPILIKYYKLIRYDKFLFWYSILINWCSCTETKETAHKFNASLSPEFFSIIG